MIFVFNITNSFFVENFVENMGNKIIGGKPLNYQHSNQKFFHIAEGEKSLFKIYEKPFFRLIHIFHSVLLSSFDLK